MARLIEVLEPDNSTEPICPHCERPVRELHLHRIRAFLGVRFLYACGHCRKVLGISHRKGFWMG